ncbi:hypothetical protein MOC96_00290 [Bacillus vallismortis]|uniref:hypothetical protein n=1 Tax=Bacillus vallismortis TaxID=72361 RepID=UPI002282A875|nr:hypothetical protein [Bacillus vallismortis]MCY8307193.1 hypothetical protein [Bacillus vallismortis]
MDGGLLVASRREYLIKRLTEDFRMVPGHGPDLSKMTDEELEKRLGFLESAFKMAWEEEEDEDEDI